MTVTKVMEHYYHLLRKDKDSFFKELAAIVPGQVKFGDKGKAECLFSKLSIFNCENVQFCVLRLWCALLIKVIELCHKDVTVHLCPVLDNTMPYFNHSCYHCIHYYRVVRV